MATSALPAGARREPFFGTVEALAVATGALTAADLTTDATGDVFIHQITAELTDAATDAQNLTDTATVLVTFTAPTLGVLTKRAAPLRALAGTGRYPFQLPSALHLAPTATLSVGLTNKHTAAVNVRLCFIGYRVVQA